MICPDCSNEINFHYQVKVKTNDGVEKLYQCPKCNGYFKETFPTSFWWSQTPLIPVFLGIFIPDNFEFKTSILLGMFATTMLVGLPITLVRGRKQKSMIKKKGEWTAVKATKEWVVIKTTNTTLK